MSWFWSNNRKVEKNVLDKKELTFLDVIKIKFAM